MKIDLAEINGRSIATLVSEKTEINNVQDAVDIMMNCAYRGAMGIVVRKKHLCPEFFDLKTGVAGDILQKFSTYRLRLAIVGDFEGVSGSLRDFIFESNKTGRINFVDSAEQAMKVLSQ